MIDRKDLPLAAGEHIERLVRPKPSETPPNNVVNLWGPYNIPPDPNYTPPAKWRGHMLVTQSMIAQEERSHPLTRDIIPQPRPSSHRLA